jgi:Cys-tRNA(Pro)/Cys-tRNA(Cys) deacylase
MDQSPPVADALIAMDIPYQLFRHDGPVNSLEQAATERGQLPEQVIRSILFRTGQDAYMMVLVAGPEQISWRNLRKHLGQSRLTMAKPDEVLTVTGYRVGTVGPFGLAQMVPILVDRSVLAQGEVSLGSGVRSVAVIVRTEDLMRALGAVDVVDLCSDEDA